MQQTIQTKTYPKCINSIGKIPCLLKITFKTKSQPQNFVNALIVEHVISLKLFIVDKHDRGNFEKNIRSCNIAR